MICRFCWKIAVAGSRRTNETGPPVGYREHVNCEISCIPKMQRIHKPNFRFHAISRTCPSAPACCCGYEPRLSADMMSPLDRKRLSFRRVVGMLTCPICVFAAVCSQTCRLTPLIMSSTSTYYQSSCKFAAPTDRVIDQLLAELPSDSGPPTLAVLFVSPHFI